LDPRSRARLAERLLGSLDDLTEAEIEELWLDEAERQEREWDAGKVEGIPADQVLRELRLNPKVPGSSAQAELLVKSAIAMSHGAHAPTNRRRALPISLRSQAPAVMGRPYNLSFPSIQWPSLLAQVPMQRQLSSLEAPAQAHPRSRERRGLNRAS
jgi:hypothetical protein